MLKVTKQEPRELTRRIFNMKEKKYGGIFEKPVIKLPIRVSRVTK